MQAMDPFLPPGEEQCSAHLQDGAAAFFYQLPPLPPLYPPPPTTTPTGTTCW